MPQITLLGATGRIGKNLLQKSINKGFQIKVLARNNEELRDFSPNVEVIEGNYFDLHTLEKVLQGSEAILSTIGPPMHQKLSVNDEENYINSLAFIIKEMEKNGQSRWLNISDAGAKMPHETLPLTRKLLRVKLKAISKSTIAIKDRELQLLEKSNLEWTSIRPPTIGDNVEGKFQTNEIDYLGTAVDLNQLTNFILAEMTDNKWLRKAPIVGTKQ